MKMMVDMDIESSHLAIINRSEIHHPESSIVHTEVNKKILMKAVRTSRQLRQIIRISTLINLTEIVAATISKEITLTPMIKAILGTILTEVKMIEINIVSAGITTIITELAEIAMTSSGTKITETRCLIRIFSRYKENQKKKINMKVIAIGKIMVEATTIIIIKMITGIIEIIIGRYTSKILRISNGFVLEPL